ncbi:MAG: MBG domain-containing protein [Vicinamibacterales bacterium]
MLTAAAAAVSIGVIAQVLPPVGVCGTGPGELNCFDPAAQGEMWRTIAPIGQRLQPNVDVAGTPEFATPVMDVGVIATDPVGNEIWVSNAGDLATAFAELAPGECTFAHLGDDPSLPRQCKAADGSMVPPPAGKLFYPSGVAVYGPTVYVSDRMNHRVDTMDFEGNPIAIAHPIGNGEPGTGAYSYSTGAAAGLSGSQLREPNGLAVDADGRLLVADGGNGRIAVFNPDGSASFASDFSIPAHPLIGGPVVPSSVAISPGASAVAPLTAPTDPAARIVVLDRYKCTVWILDTGFNPIATLPTQAPAATEPDSLCASGAFGFPAAGGHFSVLTGVTIDAGNHIYLADSFNNRVVIYDRDGALLGSVGQPPVLAPGQLPPVDAVATPSSVLIDHLGRLVVNDSDNFRLAFYTMTFPVAGPPVAQFQFEVPAAGDDLDGVPSGLAEQWGTGQGLDPAGRYLKIDTANHQVQRLELADLAIIREQAQATTPTSGTGAFAVAVPAEKVADVQQVTVTVTPSEPGVVVTSVNALPPAVQTPGATTADPNDIPRGSWVQYEFAYTNPTPSQRVTFVITAVGNKTSPQDTVADPVTVLVRGTCLACEATHLIYDYPAPLAGAPVASVSTTTDTGDWFNRRVFVRLFPKNDDPLVTSIEWFVRGSDMQRHGAGTHASPLSADVRYVDVPFFGPENEITYWPVTADQTVGPKVAVTIKIDMDPPSATFSNWPVPANVNSDPVSADFGTEWYVGDVIADFQVLDGQSGMDMGDGSPDRISGQFTIVGEGRDLHIVRLDADLVGNGGEYRTNDPERGGKVVNIDRTAPTVIAPHLEVVQTGAGFAVLEPGVFVAEATDALSGVATIINPVVNGVEFPLGVSTRPFTARDHAGNETTVTGTVTVLARSRSTIAALDVQVVYGETTTLTASVLPAVATGDVAFVFGGTTVTAALSNGIATVVIPSVTENVGTYTMQVSYAGDAAVDSASTTATVVVTPAPITVSANYQEKSYGAADPALAYRIALGALVGGDGFEGSLARAAGDDVGGYPITQGTLSLGTNYTLTVVPAELKIVPMLLELVPDPQWKYYGGSEPELTFRITSGFLVGSDRLTGAPARAAGEFPGLYLISIGTLTAGPNYQLNFYQDYLSVRPLDIYVTADALGRLVGEADPPLTYSHTPALLNGDTFDGFLRRDAGEAPGTYVIRQYGLTLPIGYMLHYTEANFVVGRRQAVVTAGDATKVWGTFPDPSIAVSAIGFLAADNITLSVSRATGENVGGYVTTPAATGTAEALNNYEITLVTGNFTITKAPVSVTAQAVTVDYGETPVFAFAYGPFPNGATAADVDVAPTCTVAAAHTDAGSYTITCSGGQDANFDFDYAPATLVVNRIPAVINAGGGTKVYGASDPALTTTHSGVLAADVAGITFTTTRVGGETAGGYDTTATATGGASGNYIFASNPGTFTITQRPITVTATSVNKFLGLIDPPLTYTITSGGPLVGTDSFSGALVRDAGELLGGYTIRQGALTAGPNYDLTFVEGTLTILGTLPPVAANDTASSVGAAPVSITVLGNDSDPDGGTLSVTAVTQPTGGEGVVTTSGNLVVFTPTPGFVGTVTFTYTISDGQGGTATATVTVTITAAQSCTNSGFTTYSQGGWGAKPKGNNPGQLLATNFARVYPGGFVIIGGTKTLKFTSAAAIAVFLPQGGTPAVLTSSAVNPTSSSAGNFAAQLLALRLAVDFSAAGVTKSGLGDLVMLSGPLAGSSVNQILVMANKVIGGQTSALPSGVSISMLNGILESLNLNYHEGTVNNGLLGCPGGLQPPAVTAANQTNYEGDAASVQVVGTDPNGDDLTYSAAGLPPGLSINPATGQIGGTLAYSAAGSYDVTLTVTDDSGLTATATFTWTVLDRNRPPVAAADSLTTTKNTAKTISVIANDSDPDGDTLTVTAVTQPAKGSVVKYANGTVKYTPPSNWVGTTSFSYTISDGNGAATATVSVTVSSHTDGDGCGDDHDHDGDHDGNDDRERDCDRDHRHNSDCDRDSNHDRDCDEQHSRTSRCNDNDGWYRSGDDRDDRNSSGSNHNHNTSGVCSNSSHYGSWYR